MFRLPLTERTTALLRRLEEMALELVEQRGTSRTALARELGVAGNTLTANLDPDRPPAETTDPRWAFSVFEHFGRDPIQVLAGLCPADSPEELLSLLPVPGLDPAEERRKRRTKAHKERVACLRAARRLDAWLPRDPDQKLARPWPERRFRDPDLEPVYRELEELEERRHRDAVAVEEACREALIRPLPDEPTLPEAIRRVGLLGTWGTVQRSKHRLEFARDALSLSIAFARRLGDESLLAKQLQRSAYLLRDLNDLNVLPSTVLVLRHASELCQADLNEAGVACTLVDRAVMAFASSEFESAKKLYRAGLEMFPPDSSEVYRAMAVQGIAVCLEMTGDVYGALKFLKTSLQCPEPKDPKFQLSLLLTSGNIERKLSQFSNAEQTYRKALDVIRGASEYDDPDSELKIYVDLAICLIQTGQFGKLRALRESVVELLPKLRNRSSIQKQAELTLRELSREKVNLEAFYGLREGRTRGSR